MPEGKDEGAGGGHAGAAPSVTTTASASSTTTSRDRTLPPGIGEAILGTSLWEAAYDQDQAVLGRAAATEGADGYDDDEDEEDEEQGHQAQSASTATATAAAAADDDADDAHGGSLLHYVTVDKGSKLGIRVRDDHPSLPKTCCVTHFDPLPSTGGPGSIEASGVVALGDFLVKVDDVSVEGKDVREVLTLIRGAADDSVILTFRRLRPLEREPPQQQEGKGQGQEEHGAGSAAGPYPLHLTEQHRAVILRHLLFGSGPRISEDRLRFLAARGIPDCDKSLRPLIWRLLLQFLGYDRDAWEEHLREQRAIYAQFVADLCVLPDEQEGKKGKKEESPTTVAGAPPAPEPPQSSASTPNSSDGGSGGGGGGSKPKKKLLVPSDSPPSSSFSSFDLDASASFAGLNRVPVSRKAPAGSDATISSSRGRSISSSTSTSTSASGGGLSASVMGSKTRPRFQSDTHLWAEIKKDVVRTYPDQAWFLDVTHGARRYDALLRALFIYAKVNPGVRYVQGMNELMGTIYFVLAAADPDPAWAAHAEADAFFCFTNLLSQMRDLFQAGLDQADSGIEGKIHELVELLALHDPQLHAHFAAIGLNAHFFVLRWLTTLFSRELLLPDTVRVWDSMLAEPGASLWSFILFFALSMILEQREALLANGFSYCLQVLQNYPSTTDVQSLLHRAEALRKHDAALRQGGGGSHHRRNSSSGPLSPSKLRGVLARVASKIEDMEVPAALDSLSAGRRRAGAQIRSSFAWLVENLTVLDDNNSSQAEGKGKGTPLQSKTQRMLPPPPAAASAGDSSSSDDDEEESGGEEEAKEKSGNVTTTAEV